MGDKTQLATLTLSGSSNKPLAVFIGASTALILASLIGAMAGGSIATIISPPLMQIIASIVFLYIGSSLLWKGTRIVKGRK